MTDDGVRRRTQNLPTRMAPVVSCLRGVGACSPELVHRLYALGARTEDLAAKTLLQTEGDPVGRPRYLLSGWACRFRHLSDGRRQIFSLYLPGDGIGVGRRPNPSADTGVMSLTHVELADAADLVRPSTLQACPELVDMLEALEDVDQHRLLDHAVRLGRMTALERTAHLLLEIHDRLQVVGQAQSGRFQFPVTQETLADMLGLSVVHVNRTLQEFRRQGLVKRDQRDAWSCDLSGLRRLTDYNSRGRGAARSLN